jgi:hypothetical protein
VVVHYTVSCEASVNDSVRHGVPAVLPRQLNKRYNKIVQCEECGRRRSRSVYGNVPEFSGQNVKIPQQQIVGISDSVRELNLDLRITRGTPWRIWLRHCATSRKVSGSIPDGVIGPGVDSAANRIEYQGFLLGGKGGWWVGLTTLPPSCADCLEILGASTSWSPKGQSRPIMGLLYLWITKRECEQLDSHVLSSRFVGDTSCSSILLLWWSGRAE